MLEVTISLCISTKVHDMPFRLSDVLNIALYRDHLSGALRQYESQAKNGFVKFDSYRVGIYPNFWV
jgi:hypothetical protein